LFIFLTVLTQTGGLIYVACLPVFSKIHTRFLSKAKRGLINLSAFIIIYLSLSFTLVPFIAKQFGRVQLPVYGNKHLQSLTILSCILNRNYVRPQLKELAETVALQMNEEYPGTVISYLDAGFPFINKFPLFPHLSHNDGRKLDLSFLYTDTASKEFINGSPSPIGYGVCEEPSANEINTAAICAEKGFWQYGFLRKIITQRNKEKYCFDAKRTRQMITLFAGSARIEKIFIEPHLTTRMHLESYSKIRFQGCGAVRHDDHLHIQVK
jgi:hypothetical protein